MLLKDFNLKYINNEEYTIEREKLYKIKNDIKKQIDNLNEELKIINDKLTKSQNISMEIGIDVTPDDSVNNLKINDEILFISYSSGYGIYKGVYERNDGYASVKDIEMVYHPKNVGFCSHRVGFKDIIKVLK